MEQAQEYSIDDTPQRQGTDMTRRTVLGGFGGAGLAALLAVGGRSGVAAQGATPQATLRDAPPIEPRLEWIGTLSVDLGDAIPIGETPHGTRLIVPATGGTFTGPTLTGTVVPGGGDWLLVRPDGVGELDIRIAVEMEDGALLYITVRGYFTRIMEVLQGDDILREEFYFAVTPSFETGAARYAWLQQTVTVGTGSLTPTGPRWEIFAVNG